jgi:predicted Fe-Mo cluster-binding NifX family protein
MSLKIALATDNGKEFAEKHFGEAKEYYIYHLDKNNCRYIKRVKKKIVPVIIKEKNLKRALKILMANYQLLLERWEKGENRDAIYL